MESFDNDMFDWVFVETDQQMRDELYEIAATLEELDANED